jgi:hypothetical protein
MPKETHALAFGPPAPIMVRKNVRPNVSGLKSNMRKQNPLKKFIINNGYWKKSIIIIFHSIYFTDGGEFAS